MTINKTHCIIFLPQYIVGGESMLKETDKINRLVIRVETDKGSIEKVIVGSDKIKSVIIESGIYDDDLKAFLKLT